MELPDFEEWADNLLLKIERADCPMIHFDNIQVALKQAFEQGYYLGLNNGWAIEQDKHWVSVDETEWTPEKQAIYDKIVNEQDKKYVKALDNLKDR